MYIVSACLAGVKCRYDGKDNTCEAIRQLVVQGKALPVCPEVLGGLSTPRIPAEQVMTDKGIKIINKQGIDVTEQFALGAKKTLEIAKAIEAHTAILKAKSPSCGCGSIYDGTFTGTLVQGDGLTTQVLKRNDIKVETEWKWENQEL